VIVATQSRGAWNTKARKELGWAQHYPGWHKGFNAARSQLKPPNARV